MRRSAGFLLLGVMAVLSGRANAQVDAAAQPAFEAATVKPGVPGTANEGRWSRAGMGRFRVTSVTLAFLIQMAYGVNDEQISGKPSWLETDLFDVDAKPADGVALSRGELKPLLQNLLQDRFHLQVHHVAEGVKGFALVVAKGGPKLMPTRHANEPPGTRKGVGPGHMGGWNWSMANLAMQLEHPAGLPVVDKTGLTGSYDLDFSYAPDLTKESSLPSLFTALQETRGLKLEEQKVTVDVVAIDHVDRVPTAN